MAALRRLPVHPQRVLRAPREAHPVDGSVAAAHWSTRLVPGQQGGFLPSWGDV